MEKLEKLLKRYGKRPGSRHWIGGRPDVRDGQIKRSILSTIGYPTMQGEFDDAMLWKQEWSSAARILAFSATMSLPYEMRQAPSVGEQKDSLDALRELDGTAQFFSNGHFGISSTTKQWNPLSTATFDTGLLGYDSSSAFVFWVEEED
jgi:hypothetical protein